jgi:DNA (cytosine-5)-methyltransferase 3A
MNINVLSLFDGISVAQQAISNLCSKGITDGYTYYASEVDKYAIQITMKNFPNTIMIGDVNNINGYEYSGIDLLIGGSPCQDLSIAKHNRQGLDGVKSGLFWRYVTIRDESRPQYFVLENVASMSSDSRDTISKALGVDCVVINAALVSAQNRKRLFWVGKLVDGVYQTVSISQPDDLGIMLKDIITDECATDRDKPYCIDANYYKGGNIKSYAKGKRQLLYKLGHVGNSDAQGNRVYSTDGKSVTLSANGGGLGGKTGLYMIDDNNSECKGMACRTRETNEGKFKVPEVRADNKSNALTSVTTDSMVLNNNNIRKLTPTECERLQCLPDNYTEGISNTQRYKCLGNAFNCAVIEHILKSIFNECEDL